MRKQKSFLITAGLFMLIFAGCTDENTSPTGDDRDNFTGDWFCAEQSTLNGTSNYTVTISKTGEADSVIIKNFYGLGSSYTALALVSGNSITIPFQNMAGGYTAQGDGLKSNSKINLTYFVNFSGLKDTVNAVYSK